MRFLYKLGTSTYHTLLLGLSPFNQKARKWIDGRKDLAQQFSSIQIKAPLIWFHCASLGEFEQGKPVMEAFKKRHPDWLLLVTFFSPSGYEIRKNYGLADYVFYLPKETKSNVQIFLDTFKPKIAVFVKYEFWYGYMAQLNSSNIPMVFISSSFRASQLFFKPYGFWFLNQIKQVKKFFVQDEKSKELLVNHGIHQVEVSGDTRFDRVLLTKKSNESIELMDSFVKGFKVLIIGSAWQMESDFTIQIVKELPDDWKLIYAPHEIEEEKLIAFERKIDSSSVRFSKLSANNYNGDKILILDTIGHLARMYKYGDVALVGGGFIDGIHNILEPLTFGLPVFFGPNHNAFWEANEAINKGVGFEVNDYNEFRSGVVKYFQNPSLLDTIKEDSRLFVERRAGATKVVSEFLNKIGQIISCQI